MPQMEADMENSASNKSIHQGSRVAKCNISSTTEVLLWRCIAHVLIVIFHYSRPELWGLSRCQHERAPYHLPLDEMHHSVP